MNLRGGRLRLAALVAAISIFGTLSLAAAPARPDTGTGGTTTTTPTTTEASAPHVVKVERKGPARRKVARVRFRPWGRPSPSKVRKIIRIEARRWHVSASGLARRAWC